jgi:hypothetical protein|tara:strand:- start:106 stop:303 length:198 start_codon:yes stop_codon:yes gene_type:complete
MNRIKDITVLIMVVGLMGLLGLIVVDEFMMASEHGGKLDANIVELLQMSITGIVGIVAGYISGKG